MYREMYRAAEEGMTYMDQTLRNCEYFLIHDQDKENEELIDSEEDESTNGEENEIINLITREEILFKDAITGH